MGSLGDPIRAGNAVDSTIAACPCRRTGSHFAGTCCSGANMQDFVYQSAPMRVVFGAGAVRELPAELNRLGVCRALVLATPQQQAQAGAISGLIGERAAGIFAGAVMH